MSAVSRSSPSDISNDTVKYRISELISRAGGVAKTASLTGIPKGTLEKYAAGTSAPSISKAAKIAEAVGVPLDYLTFGGNAHWSPKDVISELVRRSDYGGVDVQGIVDPAAGSGAFLVGAAALSAADIDKEALSRETYTERDADMVVLPVYSVEASAGFGHAVLSEQAVKKVAFQESLLRELGAHPKHCSVILARGDSMHPTIPDGSMLVVDREQREIRDGCLYVFNLEGDLLVKRVRKYLTERALELVSDNQLYPPEKVDRSRIDQLNVVGRVVYFCRVP